MGHPIDPTDPVNGACPICEAYIPIALEAVYLEFGGDEYSGFVRKTPFPFVHWEGELFSDVPLMRRCFLNFCQPPGPDVTGSIQGGPTFRFPDANCDFPMLGATDDGGLIGFALEGTIL